jgi:hypothetical protein
MLKRHVVPWVPVRLDAEAGAEPEPEADAGPWLSLVRELSETGVAGLMRRHSWPC